MWRRMWLPAVCHVCRLSCFWVDSTTTSADTHIHTLGHAHELQPQPAHMIRKRRKNEGRGRERDMFPSVRQMVFVRQPSDVDLGESPFQYTHTHTQTHTHTHTHTHTESCKYMWRQQSPAKVQVWTTSATGPATHTHTCKDTVILSWAQTKPGAVFHRRTLIQQTHTLINMHRCTRTNTHVHKLTTKEKPAHDGSGRQSVMAGWSCADSLSTPEM